MGTVVISTVGHLLDCFPPQSIGSRDGPLTLRATTPNPTVVQQAQTNQVQQSNGIYKQNVGLLQNHPAHLKHHRMRSCTGEPHFRPPVLIPDWPAIPYPRRGSVETLHLINR